VPREILAYVHHISRVIDVPSLTSRDSGFGRPTRIRLWDRLVCVIR